MKWKWQINFGFSGTFYQAQTLTLGWVMYWLAKKVKTAFIGTEILCWRIISAAMEWFQLWSKSRGMLCALVVLTSYFYPRSWSSMSITEKSSLLNSFSHLELGILENSQYLLFILTNNKQNIEYFPSRWLERFCLLFSK